MRVPGQCLSTPGCHTHEEMAMQEDHIRQCDMCTENLIDYGEFVLLFELVNNYYHTHMDIYISNKRQEANLVFE